MSQPLSLELAAMADAMKPTDPRRPLLRAAVVQLKAWEMHVATREKEARREPEPEPPTPDARCGLCGNEGPRLTWNCPECGERW